MPVPHNKAAGESIEKLSGNTALKQRYSTITVLAIFVAFGFLYLTNKVESVSGQQYELEEKLNDLDARVEDIQQ